MLNLKYLLPFIPPFLYSFGNILDKELVHYKDNNTNPQVIVTVSSFLAVIVLPFIYFLYKPTLFFSIDIIFMIISGCLTALSVYLYLRALSSGSLFSVAPALQIIPIFSYLFGYLFFGELLSKTLILGGIFILIGSFFLTVKVEEEDNKKNFKFKIFFYTTLSSLALAVSGTFFKFYAIKYSYWTVQFYEYLGLFILGLFLIGSSKTIRNRISEIFIHKIRQNKKFIFLNLSTEGIMVSGDLMLNYVVLIFPLFIAYSLNAMQPLFLLLTYYLLKKITKKMIINTHINPLNTKEKISIFLIVLGAIVVSGV